MNKFNLNQLVHFLDLKSKTVKSGNIVQIGISVSGHIVYSIIDVEKQIKTLEEAFVHPSEDEALPALESTIKITKEMDRINKDLVDKIDIMRSSLLGKPQLPDLIPQKKG